MAGRKIEAELQLTTDDSALDDVEDRLKKIESRDVEVNVETNVDEAKRDIDRFDDQLDGLSRDAVELRIEFKRQTIERDIRNTLRDLERLEDPVEIDARSDDLERAQSDLRDLAELADRKYEIDVDADPRRTAQRAAGDLDSMRERGEGLQSAVPALRGFTDELGGSAAQAGIASQAIADLGDFSLIMGERFGISETATARLGTALGALGLGGVIIGGAVAGFQLLQSEQRKVAENTTEAANALADQADEITGVTDRIEDLSRTDPILQAIFGDSDDEQIRKVTEALGNVGLTVDDLGPTLRGLDTDARAFITSLAATNPELAQYADAVGDAIARSDNWESSITTLATGIKELLKQGGVPEEVIDANEDYLRGIEELQDQVDDTDLSSVFESGLSSLKATSDGLDAVNDAAAELGSSADDVDVYQRALELLAERADDSAGAEKALADETSRSSDVLAEAEERARARADAHRAAAEAILEEANAALEAAGANRSLADIALDITQKTDDWNAALFTNTAAIGETAVGTAEYNDIVNSTITSAAGLADTAVEQAGAMKAANGETLSASDATSVWNQSMVGAARQASGPLRQAIIDYIAQVNGIPPEKVSDIIADTDYASVAEASGALDDASATRQAQIDAEANTANARSQIDSLTGYQGEATVAVRYFTRGQLPGGAYLRPGEYSAPIGATPATLAADDDDALLRAQTAQTMSDTLTGPPVPVVVGTRGATRSITNVTVNLPRAAEARDVERALRRWARVNGRQR